MTTDSGIFVVERHTGSLRRCQIGGEGVPLNNEASLQCVLAWVSPGRIWISGTPVNGALEWGSFQTTGTEMQSKNGSNETALFLGELCSFNIRKPLLH